MRAGTGGFLERGPALQASDRYWGAHGGSVKVRAVPGVCEVGGCEVRGAKCGVVRLRPCVELVPTAFCGLCTSRAEPHCGSWPRRPVTGNWMSGGRASSWRSRHGRSRGVFPGRNASGLRINYAGRREASRPTSQRGSAGSRSRSSGSTWATRWGRQRRSIRISRSLSGRASVRRMRLGNFRRRMRNWVGCSAG